MDVICFALPSSGSFRFVSFRFVFCFVLFRASARKREREREDCAFDGWLVNKVEEGEEEPLQWLTNERALALCEFKITNSQ